MRYTDEVIPFHFGVSDYETKFKTNPRQYFAFGDCVSFRVSIRMKAKIVMAKCKITPWKKWTLNLFTSMGNLGISSIALHAVMAQEDKPHHLADYTFSPRPRVGLNFLCQTFAVRVVGIYENYYSSLNTSKTFLRRFWFAKIRLGKGGISLSQVVMMR